MKSKKGTFHIISFEYTNYTLTSMKLIENNSERYPMKVYLLKDIKGIGIAGEIIKVKEGYADNFLIPRKLAVKVTAKNEVFYQSKAKSVEDRKQVIASNTSILAQKIGELKIALKRKMHDDGKLYASINPSEIVDLLQQEGVSISKSQVKLTKSIKEKGTFPVTIKLSTKLQPQLKLQIVAEK